MLETICARFAAKVSAVLPPTTVPKQAASFAIGAAALLIGGCADISSYRTADDEKYCGNVISAAMVRHGFEETAKMRLSLDTHSLQQKPGVLSTSDAVFDNAEMFALAQLQNDALSSLQFGEGRTRNIVLGAQPTRGPTALVVVSLMDDGNVEVRVVRGAPPAASDQPQDQPDDGLFGVFPLKKEKGLCGF